MSDGEKTERIQHPVERSQVHLADGQLPDAASSLRQPSALASDDTAINGAWDALKISEGSTADASELCRAYITTKDETIGEKAIIIAKQTELSFEAASETIRSLLDSEDLNVSTKGLLISTLTAHINGAKSLATIVHNRPTETFAELWQLGILNIDGLVQILIKPEVWHSGDDQAKAVRDCFLLLLAKLSDLDVTHHEIAMRSVAKLMATNAAVLAAIIDDEKLAIILSFLDFERPVALKSQATLIVAKFLEISSERGQDMLKNFVTSRFGAKSDEVVAAASVAATIFPLIPGFGAQLFLTPGFMEDLLRLAGQSRKRRLRRAILELLSAACMDKDCRAKIYKVYGPWLEEILHVSGASTEDTALAGLVLSKLRQESSGSNKTDNNADVLNEVVLMFKDMVVKSGEMDVQTAIEGLAYNSIDPTVKEQLANDPTFLKKLVNALTESSTRGPLLFGGLTIISNITIYRPALSAEETRVAQLKAYASKTSLAELNLFDEESHVTLRCRKVLDAGVATVLTGAIRTKNASGMILNLASLIVLSLSNERKHCGIMAQKGLFDPVLLLAHLDQEDAGGILPQVRRQSAQALSRILISVDPALLFTKPERTVQKCIGPLKFLLSPLEPLNPQYPFDALRALTNLAGFEEYSARLVSDNCFTSIAVYLQSSRSALQQAATECICNLSGSLYFLLSHLLLEPGEGEPYGPDFDMEKPSAGQKEVHFLLLIRLTSSQARGTRLAAMGALQAAMGIEPGREMLIRAPRGLEHVVAALADAQTPVSAVAEGSPRGGAYIEDLAMRLRATCVIQDLCCNTEDIEVYRRLSRCGVMKLLTEGAKHLPSDEETRKHLLSYTEPLIQRLKAMSKK